MMTTPDVLFERELEIFRTEEETVTQFFYAYEAVHNVAADQQQVRALLNQAPLFWNTCLGALQTASIIALGRVIDQSSEHNIDGVLGIAQKNLGIFSKSALGLRKQGNGPTRPVWLNDFLRDVYEPTAKDFRRLRAHINKRRKIYNSNYADLRHKWFAHKEVSDPEQAAELFGKTNIRELQKDLCLSRKAVSGLVGTIFQWPQASTPTFAVFNKTHEGFAIANLIANNGSGAHNA